MCQDYNPITHRQFDWGGLKNQPIIQVTKPRKCIYKTCIISLKGYFDKFRISQIVSAFTVNSFGVKEHVKYDLYLWKAITQQKLYHFPNSQFFVIQINFACTESISLHSRHNELSILMLKISFIFIEKITNFLTKLSNYPKNGKLCSFIS